MLEAIARGLYRGADEAGIAIPGGEIAQIGAMLADSAGGGPMLDLVGTAVGAIPDGRSPGGRVRGPPGRRRPGPAQFRPAQQRLLAGPPGAGRAPWTARARHRPALADALLAPTRVYVRAAEALWAAGITPRGLAHISGGGLLNLARLAADVSYALDALPPAPAIFALIAEAGDIPAATMYATFNMGTGFCVVVSPADADAALRRPDRPRGSSPSWPARSPPAPAATCRSRRRDCWAAAMCSKRCTIPSRHGRPWLCRVERARIHR